MKVPKTDNDYYFIVHYYFIIVLRSCVNLTSNSLFLLHVFRKAHFQENPTANMKNALVLDCLLKK